MLLCSEKRHVTHEIIVTNLSIHNNKNVQPNEVKDNIIENRNRPKKSSNLV